MLAAAYHVRGFVRDTFTAGIFFPLEAIAKVCAALAGL